MVVASLIGSFLKVSPRVPQAPERISFRRPQGRAPGLAKTGSLFSANLDATNAPASNLKDNHGVAPNVRWHQAGNIYRRRKPEGGKTARGHPFPRVKLSAANWGTRA
jgi:hypothetical protein